MPPILSHLLALSVFTLFFFPKRCVAWRVIPVFPDTSLCFENILKLYFYMNVSLHKEFSGVDKKPKCSQFFSISYYFLVSLRNAVLYCVMLSAK